MNYNGSSYADLLNTSTVSADEVIIGNLILPNLDPNSIPYIDSSNNVLDRVLNDGQILIGQTNGPPLTSSLTGTTDEIIVTNGPGSITLSTPQPIATTSSPTFADVTTTNLYESTNGYTLIGPGTPATNSFNICSDNNLNGTNNSIIIGDNNLANIRPKAAFCNLGSAGAPFQTVYLTGDVHGLTYNRSADNIISCSTSQTADNLVAFDSLQKVIKDTGISSLSGPWLPLTGGTMSGDINMGAHDVTSVGKITTNSTVVNVGKTNTTVGANDIVYGVLNTFGGAGGGSSTVCGNGNNLSGSTNGQSIIYGNSNVDSNSSGGTFIYGFSNTNGTGARNILLGRNNTVTNGVNDAYVMGFNNTNSTSNSLLVGNVNSIRAGLTCDLGTTASKFQNVYASGNLIGAVKTSAVDSIVTGPVSATGDNLCSYDSTTGKIIKDSGISSTNVVTGPASAVGDNVCSFNSTTGKIIKDSGLSSTSIVTGPVSAVSDNLCSFNSTTGKIIKDSGVSATNLVTGPASAVNNNLCSFNSTTGKIIKDSNILSSNVFLADGTVSMTGVLNETNVTDSTLTTNGSIVTAGGIGVAKACTIGTTLKVNGTTDSTTTSTGTIITPGGVGIAKAVTVGTTVKANGTTDSTSTSTGTIITTGGIGVAKGIYANNLNVTSTTDSTSPTTGAIITAGGIGTGKQIDVGTNLLVNGFTRVYSATDSTSSITGAITCSGGVGILSRLSVGSNCTMGVDRTTPLANLEVAGSTGILITDGGASATIKQCNIFYNAASDRSEIISSHVGSGNTDLICSIKNFGINSGASGSGSGVICLGNCSSAPSTNPATGGILYVQSGALKYRGSSGTVTTIANA